MQLDLSNKSLAELRQIEKDVAAAIEERKKTEVAAARQQIEAIAQSVGIPLQDLLGSAQGKGVKKGKGTGSVAVRYRHPEDANLQWTGRGRQPKWVKEWVEGGKAIEDLLV